jgi:hypothetical protein
MKVTINGRDLTEAQADAVRQAVSHCLTLLYRPEVVALTFGGRLPRSIAGPLRMRLGEVENIFLDGDGGNHAA